LRNLPTVAPDNREISNGWTVTRIPNDNSESSRFIATKVA
jgi:hypothetical protein